VLKPGYITELSPQVRRIVAPNPGPMTGPGTNTFLLGRDQIIVLDPGPLIDEHVERILEAGEGRISAIVCTHTHRDHSPAWQPLAQATGATVYGAVAANDPHQDETFSPGVALEHEMAITTSELELVAIHTPGHVSNHFCFLLREEGMLFAGDHIMNGSTVVIIPPGGDMAAYIASLQRLLDYPLASIAPGHGELIHEPRAEIERLVAHRLGRERKVAAGLEAVGPCDLDALVRVVYDDVDEALHEWAKLSMTAHLIKLEQDGRAQQQPDATWMPVASNH
jgi:glyoxylase-like metal-dependent hydrolase (beta-lactamase superfamily II)